MSKCVMLQDGFGTANTALIFHAQKLLALNEGDLPYAVSILLFMHTHLSSLHVKLFMPLLFV